MSFNLIFQSLMEIFPQVDARILRAVSIEHSVDVDAAVESVLIDVLPAICSSEEVLLTTGYNQVQYPSIGGAEVTEANSSLKCEVVKEANGGPPSELSSVACEDVRGTDQINDVLYVKSRCLDEASMGSSVGVHVENDHYQLSVDTATEELISSTNHQETVGGSNHISYTVPRSWTYEDAVVSSCYGNSLCADIQECHGEVSHYCVSAVCGDDHQDNLCLDAGSSKEETTIPHVECLLDELNPGSMEHMAMVQRDVSTSVSECQEPRSRDLLENGAEPLIFDNDMVDVDDESLPTTMATRSGQTISIKFLEEFVTDAKSNKEMLVSAMESLVSMAREVEIQEKAAEQAKEEALRGGLDVLTKVEDLKQMLQRAKEANAMHAGEVYGEKFILATEARELQSRLLNLSDKKDKSLLIMDEMRQNLEARLAAADAEKAAAEQEKLEKEENAHKALAEQTLIMDKVVQESKKLQQEAEENAKLREFLVDCGHSVDILQGEIAVICEDINLLKERIDNRLSISKSLALSQTSCTLASSSTMPCQVPEQPEGLSEGLKKTTNQELPNSESSENSTTNSVDENAIVNNQTVSSKVCSEDEWEKETAIVNSQTTPSKVCSEDEWEIFLPGW